MSAFKRFAQNSAALFAARVLVALFGLMITIAIARALGDAAFGNYSFAVAFSAIFVLVADLGYFTLATREVSKDPELASKYLANMTGLLMVMITALYVSMILIVNLLGYSEDQRNIVYLFGAYAFITTLSGSYLVIFRAFERMKYEAIIKVSEGLLRLVLATIVLYLGLGLIELGWMFLLSSLTSLVACIWVTRRLFFRPRIQLDLRFIKHTIGTAISLAILPVISMLYIRADTILLSLMEGERAVGWYNAAYNIVLTLEMIPAPLVMALFPAAVRISVMSCSAYHDYYRRLMKYLVLLGIPVSIGLILLAEPVILLIYGPQFIGSIDVMRILAIDALLIFIYMPMGNALVGMGHERKVAVSSLSCLLINVALNILLIPTWSLIGAAVATVISEIILILSYMYLMSRNIGSISVIRPMVRPVIASVPMIAVVVLLRVNVLICIPLAMMAYLVTIFLIGGFEDTEVRAIRIVLDWVRGRLLDARP